MGEQFTLAARRLVHQPATIHWTPNAADTTVVIGMTPLAQTLATVAIVEREPPPSRLSGFEARAAAKAGGTFIIEPMRRR